MKRINIIPIATLLLLGLMSCNDLSKNEQLEKVTKAELIKEVKQVDRYLDILLWEWEY